MRRIRQPAAVVASVTLSSAAAPDWAQRGMCGEDPQRDGTAAAIHLAPED